MDDVGLKVALEVGEVRSLPAAEELVLEVAEDLLGRRVVQAVALAGHALQDAGLPEPGATCGVLVLTPMSERSTGKAPPASCPTACQASRATYLAGLNAGYWKGLDSLRANAVQATRLKPELAEGHRRQSLDGWYRALNRARS